MKKILSAIFIFVCFARLSFAATGDITGVEIVGDPNASGWYSKISIEGLETGGTYDFGIDPNTYYVPDPNEAKVIFTVTSQGYDANCSTTTLERTVYGTYWKRKPYPDANVADEVDANSVLTVSMASEEWIYASDANITCDIGAATYTDANIGANNAAADVAVTNNSNEEYPRVIANWSWPGYQRITGSSFNLYCLAYHRSADQGCPVKAVKFWATDEHSNTVTTIVTSPSIDADMEDAHKVTEFIGAISTSTLTQGDTITCNFAAYPIYGDANSVLDTSDGVNSNPSALYCPQKYVLDKDGTYGSPAAVVSPTGNDGTGTTIAGSSFDHYNPPAAYLTIAGAVAGLEAYNTTNHSRTNAGGGTVYLQNGTYALADIDSTTSEDCWITVTKFPGTARHNVIVQPDTGGLHVGDKCKFVNLTLDYVGSTNYQPALWLHRCFVDYDGSYSLNYSSPSVNYCTQCDLHDLSTNYGLSWYSGRNSPWCIIRGNRCTQALSSRVDPYVVVGNDFNNVILRPNTSLGQPAPFYSNCIVAYNIFTENDQSIINDYSDFALTDGLAVIQNLFEFYGAGSAPILRIAGDSSTSDPVNNGLFINNTLVGDRINVAYNDSNLDPNSDDGPGPIWRDHWLFMGNITDSMSVVTDIHAHGGDPGGTRYGNHALRHGVGRKCNLFTFRQNVGSTQFWGLSSRDGGDTTLAPQYRDDNTKYGDGGGGGNYTLRSTSPAIGLAWKYALPYDLKGRTRKSDGTGAVGAYERISTWAHTIAGVSGPASVAGVAKGNIYSVAGVTR